jgi:hypothetical protein
MAASSRSRRYRRDHEGDHRPQPWTLGLSRLSTNPVLSVPNTILGKVLELAACGLPVSGIGGPWCLLYRKSNCAAAASDGQVLGHVTRVALASSRWSTPVSLWRVLGFVYGGEDGKTAVGAWTVSVFRPSSGVIFPIIAPPRPMYRITCPSRAPYGGPPPA